MDVFFFFLQGALFLFFAGRLEEVKGNIDEVKLFILVFFYLLDK